MHIEAEVLCREFIESRKYGQVIPEQSTDKGERKLENPCDIRTHTRDSDKVMAEIADMTDSAKTPHDEALSAVKESLEKAGKKALSEYEQSIKDLNFSNGSASSIMETGQYISSLTFKYVAGVWIDLFSFRPEFSRTLPKIRTSRNFDSKTSSSRPAVSFIVHRGITEFCGTYVK